MRAKSTDLFKYISPSPGEKPHSPPKIIQTPQYCPNSNCSFHQGFEDSGNYSRNGFCKTVKYPGTNQRYICNSCGKSFSSNTFSMDFRKRHIGLGPLILESISNGKTIRSTSRTTGITEVSLRKRIKDMARQALIVENQFSKNISIKEEIAYDGFESFCGSQFSPNNINTAVGRWSLYTYATTYSPLNRKGKMTKWQKLENGRLQKTFGKYPGNSVGKETQYIFEKLIKYSHSNQLTIWTDEHKAYKSAVGKMSGSKFLLHKTVSSKKKRDWRNPLFAVNHLHLLNRHYNSAHRRETISFNKNEAGVMDRITLCRIHKNFFRSKYVKKTKGDPRADVDSPAMKIGLCNNLLRFEDFFQHRKMIGHCDFDLKEKETYERRYDFSRQTIAA